MTLSSAHREGLTCSKEYLISRTSNGAWLWCEHDQVAWFCRFSLHICLAHPSSVPRSIKHMVLLSCTYVAENIYATLKMMQSNQKKRNCQLLSPLFIPTKKFPIAPVSSNWTTLRCPPIGRASFVRYLHTEMWTNGDFKLNCVPFEGNIDKLSVSVTVTMNITMDFDQGSVGS